MASTTPVVLIIIDLIMLVAGCVYGLAVLLPSFGSRLLGRYAPSAIVEPRRKRLAVIRATGFALVFLIIGVAGLAGDLMGAPPDTVRRVGVSLLIFLAALAAIIAQARLNRS